MNLVLRRSIDTASLLHALPTPLHLRTVERSYWSLPLPVLPGSINDADYRCESGQSPIIATAAPPAGLFRLFLHSISSIDMVQMETLLRKRRWFPGISCLSSRHYCSSTKKPIHRFIFVLLIQEISLNRTFIHVIDSSSFDSGNPSNAQRRGVYIYFTCLILIC